MIPPTISLQLPAHGVGGATDLPIPYAYALVGAAWALAISFAVLAFAWKEPRLQRPEPALDRQGGAEPPRRAWLAVLGLAITAWFLGTLFLGPDDATNPGLGAVYILTWVGLVPLALLAGHVWKDLSPWRTAQWAIGRLTGRREGFATYPEGLGYWPAAVGLFGFVWLELVSPDAGDVGTVRTWVAAYAVLTVAGGVVFGPRWFDRADPFDVYSAFVARLAPLVDRRRFAPHNPLVSLPHLPIRAGLVAVIAVLLGSTAFDSFSASPFWQRQGASTFVSTLMLLLFAVVVATAFWLASRATGGVSRAERRALPGETAHTLVPIVVGYIFAHYLSYLAEGGQRAVVGLLQQIGLGDDLTVSYFLSEHPDVLAIYKVMFVVAGHVVAVVAAHDIALKVLPRAHRLTGQLAMLVLMVAYTFGGIYLLFSV